MLNCLKKIVAVPSDTPLWVMLEFRVGKVPALIDTGAQFSCVWSDVAEFLHLREEPCVFTSCALSCLLADGRKCEVTDAVKLHVKLMSFAWTHKFKVLREGSFPMILGLDFLERTRMLVDVASWKIQFWVCAG